MQDPKMLGARQNLMQLAEDALKQERFYDAIEYSIAGHVITRDTDDNMVMLVTLFLACEKILAKNHEEVVKNYRERRDETERCSFCEKKRSNVKTLVAGSGGVFICNECVDLCHKIVSNKKRDG